jgi:hypothetical protein
MKVVEIKGLERKDLPIYYRREFCGQAVLELMDKTQEKRLEFVIEHKPMGGVDIHVSLLDPVDYPLLPIVKSLKTFILELDKRGNLP